MRIPDPKANTTIEAYLAYKAGFLEESELKPKLYKPDWHFDGWLAYWAGLVGTYPNKGAGGKNLFNPALFDGITAGANGGYVSSKYYSVSTEVTFNLKPNTNYILSLRDENYDLSGIAWSVAIDGTWKNVSSGSLVITTGSSGQFALKIGASSYSNIGTSERFIQLEQGSSATSYEPYYAEPDMLCDEEALIAYLSGVTDTYPEEIKDPYDVRIVGYLKHLVSIRWPEPDYPVNNSEFYLSTMKPTFVPSGDPSSDIEIDGTAKGPFIDLKMYGDTYQQTYSGKNLFGAQDATITNKGVEQTLSDYNHLVLYGTASDNYPISRNLFATFYNPLPAGTYTLTLYGKMEGTTSKGLNILLYRQDGTEIQGIGNAVELNSPRTFTVNEPVYSMTWNRNMLTGITIDFDIRFELEQGSSAPTSYEPYTGGIPAPSPSYPMPISVVTGEQTVEVHGKNLFNIDDTFGQSVAPEITVDSDGWMHVNYDNTSSGTVYLNYRTNLLPLKTNTEYATIMEIKSVSGSGNVVPVNGGTVDQFTNTKSYPFADLSNKGVYKYTDTTKSSFDGITRGLSSYIRFGAGQSGSITFRISVLADTSVTPATFAYEPYQSQSYPISLGDTELCKIGDYRDGIYKSGDDWYVHKETGKIVFDGSENWQRNDTNEVFTLADAVPYSVDGTAPYSNYFMGQANVVSYARMEENSVGFLMSSSNNRTIIKYLGETSVSGFKTWLSLHNTVVEYPLATPTDTQITNSELISQLDALMEGGSYEGKTYIKVTATDPNLPGLLYVEAGKYD